jgi:hypothetical protein
MTDLPQELIDELPTDFMEPDWNEYERVHCWRNYVSDSFRAIWHLLTPRERAILSLMAYDRTDDERWD